jgi:hypothetical protein
MSYVSLLKNLPEFLSQPAGIAAIASLGIHGALGFLLPLMPVDSPKDEASKQRTVGVMNLNAAEQARLPQVNPQPQSPQLGISSQVTLPNFATQSPVLPPLGNMPPLNAALPPLGQLPIDKYPRVTPLPNANQKNNQKIDPRVAIGGTPMQQYPIGGVTPRNSVSVGNLRQQNPMVYAPPNSMGYTPQPNPIRNTPSNPPEYNPVLPPPPPAPSASLNFGPPITVARTNEPATDAMRRVSGIDDYLKNPNWQQGSPDQVAGDNNNNAQGQGTEVAAVGTPDNNQSQPNQPATVGKERTSGELVAALRNSPKPGVAPSEPNESYTPSRGAVQAIANVQTLQDLQQQNPGAKISTNIRRTINSQGDTEGNASGYMVVKDGRIAQVVWINRPSSGDGEQAVKNSLSQDVKGNDNQIIPFDVRLNASNQPAEGNQQKPASAAEPLSQPKPSNNRQQPTTSNNRSPQAQPSNNSPASLLRPTNNSPQTPTSGTRQPQQRQSNPIREIQRSKPGNSEPSRQPANNSPQSPVETKQPPQRQGNPDREIRRQQPEDSAASRQRSNNSSQSPSPVETKQPPQQENKSWRERLRPEN